MGKPFRPRWAEQGSIENTKAACLLIIHQCGRTVLLGDCPHRPLFMFIMESPVSLPVHSQETKFNIQKKKSYPLCKCIDKCNYSNHSWYDGNLISACFNYQTRGMGFIIQPMNNTWTYITAISFSCHVTWPYFVTYEGGNSWNPNWFVLYRRPVDRIYVSAIIMKWNV